MYLKSWRRRSWNIWSLESKEGGVRPYESRQKKEGASIPTIVNDSLGTIFNEMLDQVQSLVDLRSHGVSMAQRDWVITHTVADDTTLLKLSKDLTPLRTLARETFPDDGHHFAVILAAM